MKRILSILLVLCMVAACLPVGVLAQEMPRALSGIWINPLYEGMVTEGDLAACPHDARRNPDVPKMTYHTDVAAAGQEIRKSLERREKNFSVGFEIPYEDYTNEGLGILAGQILDVASAHTGVPTQGDYLRWQFGGAGFGAQGYSHNDDKTGYLAVITFDMLYYTDAKQEKEVTKRVEKLLRELEPEGSDYEKLTTVYDWICDNVVYDYDHDPEYPIQYTAYGALIDGTSVCQGFSLLLYRLALELGIDCRLISGIGITPEESGAHSWNILKLDGEYYNADVTWDINYAEDDDYAYYLLNEEHFGVDHIRDEEYTAAEFQASYPISAEDYAPPVDEVPDVDDPIKPGDKDDPDDDDRDEPDHDGDKDKPDDDDRPEKGVEGDLNGDTAVDDSDVALLLWYTLFPENYTIFGNADVNGDGRIDDADVAYLLWHTLFPENYPLK